MKEENPLHIINLLGIQTLERGAIYLLLARAPRPLATPLELYYCVKGSSQVSNIK